jgi:hypothetical protein
MTSLCLFWEWNAINIAAWMYALWVGETPLLLGWAICNAVMQSSALILCMLPTSTPCTKTTQTVLYVGLVALNITSIFFVLDVAVFLLSEFVIVCVFIWDFVYPNTKIYE